MEHLGRVDQDTVIGYDPVTDSMGFEETQSGLVVLRLAYAEGRASLFSMPPCPNPAASEAL